MGRKTMTEEEIRASIESRYPGMLERLGVDTDRQIALDHDITRAYVGSMRKSLGIDPAPTSARATVQRVNLSGTVTVRNAAGDVLGDEIPCKVSITLPAGVEASDVHDGIARLQAKG